jgi:hypothetical protein
VAEPEVALDRVEPVAVERRPVSRTTLLAGADPVGVLASAEGDEEVRAEVSVAVVVVVVAAEDQVAETEG